MKGSLRAGFSCALALALSLGTAAAPAAADTPYALQLNARGIEPSKTPGALERAGVVYIDVARATRIFDGLVTFSGDGVRLSLQHSIGDFTIGRTTARLAGTQITLPGAPFREFGTVYLPITPVVVRLAGARLHLDEQAHVAQILVGRPPGATPAPSVSQDDGALQPSLGQALRLMPSGSVDATGLHVRVEILNRTNQPVVANFATGAQIAFLVYRNGTEVWDSTSGKMYVQAETALNFEPHGAKSFSDLWTGFNGAGPGSYSLRAKLLTETPLVSSPVSLGVFPAPAAT